VLYNDTRSRVWSSGTHATLPSVMPLPLPPSTTLRRISTRCEPPLISMPPTGAVKERTWLGTTMRLPSIKTPSAPKITTAGPGADRAHLVVVATRRELHEAVDHAHVLAAPTPDGGRERREDVQLPQSDVGQLPLRVACVDEDADEIGRFDREAVQADVRGV